MSEIDLDAEALEKAVVAARDADVLAIPNHPGFGVKLRDYLEYTAGDAVELGVVLVHKDADGKPRFHWYSDIRSDEHDDTENAILRPLIEAAIRTYFRALSKAGTN